MHIRNEMKHRWISILLCLLMIFSLIPAGHASTTLRSAPLTQGNTQNGMVRVRLSSLGYPSTLNLTVYGSYTVNGKSTQSIASGSNVKISFSSTTGNISMTVNGVTTDMGTAFKLRRHETSGTNGIKIAQGRVPSNLYPGDFYFVSRQSGSGYQLYTIAYIYIEDYLYGVLPYEMGNSSGLEALKAQAVSARTYTVRAMSAASSNLYDVVDTTSDQVYSGTPSGNENCKAAVDATKGIVAKNGSAFTATYYTASNGGQVESVKNAWGSNTYTYLKVKDDPYDLANPASKKLSFYVAANGEQTDTVLKNLLNDKAASKFGAGAKVIAVSDVTPHTPKYASPSRLYTKLDFDVTYTLNGQTATGTLTFDIFGELEYTMAMSINSGKNELWSVSKSSSGFTVYARRYGHGVGMSQRGAMYMAQLGYTYDQILAFYFEGCSRVRYTFTRSILSPVIEGQESQEQVIPENPAELEQAQSGTAIVTLSSVSAKLPLRTAPYASASVITELPHGATVKVYAQNGNDCLVGYGSLCGYVSTASLSINGDIPSSTTATPTIPVSYGTVINSDALNLRSGASKSSSVLTTIPRNTVLPILRMEGTWAYTQYGLRTGYVSTDYLQISGNNTSTTTPDGPKAYITAQSWMRVTANTNGYVVSSLPAGTEVALIATDGSWALVRFNKQTGYVQASAVNYVGGQTAQSTDDTLGSGESYAVVKSSSTLNLRATPSTDGILMDEMPTGTRLIVEKYGSEWCTVRFRGIRGYVMTKYISVESAPAATPIPGTSQLQARVTTAQGSLNLRATASASGKLLTTIPQYAVIPVLSKGSTWCQTSYNGHTGYVMTKFLSFIDNEPAVTATPLPTPAPAPTNAPEVQQLYARVTTASGSLNLRASVGGMIIRTIPQNAVIPVLEKGSVWSKTTYGGVTGFVMTEYLTFLAGGTSPVPTAAPTQAPTQAPNNTLPNLYARVVTASGSLNLRAQPKSNAAILGSIPQYATIPILESGSVWCKTVYNGTVGYVMTSFLSLFQQNGSVSAPTPAPTPLPTPVPTAAPSSGVQYARVTTQQGSLNMRTLPDSGAAIIRTIPQYAIVTVLQKNASWAQVTYEGTAGYVMTSFLTMVSSNSTPIPTPVPTPVPVTPTPTQAPQLKYARVTTASGSLNMRYAKRDDASVIRTIPQYAYVTVLEWGSDWCRVTYGGNTGYVKANFLTGVSSIPTETPVPTKAPAASSGTGSGSYAKISTLDGSLNLRSAPKGGNNIIGSIPQYAVVPVLSKGTEWCQVSYNGLTGYVMTAFLTFQSTPGSTGSSGSTSSGNSAAQYDSVRDYTLKTLQTPVLGQVKPKSGNSVKLMKGCSEYATVMDTMNKNEYVVIKAAGDLWCEVLYESTSGFCKRELLEFVIYE